MTDKQIIIDGVDVSGCDFLAKKDDYCSYSGITYAYKGQCMCSDEEMCKEHPKCFYKKVLKQLKAKKQECEELKEQLESTKGLVTVGNKQIIQSLEKVEDLKNELHSKVEFIQEQRNVIDEYSKEIEMYKRCQGNRASKREEKLKQTLTEIKEIAEWHTTKADSEDVQEDMKQILQKINECEINNEC